jgi:synaptic vesicle membrane protein VAT-1
MKQIWIARAGGPEVLEVRETADPTPGSGEIAIAVDAAGVNFADVLARMGKYPDSPPIPCVVGYEVAGTVAAVGPPHAAVGPPGSGAGRDSRPGVSAGSAYAVGDRVVALTRFGGYSSTVCVPVANVFAMPDEMTMLEAAAIPVNYFTASLALDRFANVQPDERVLIHNAGGGVGVAAIQLAKAAGAVVYGTASAWKHDQLRLLGADELIDYRTEDWVERIRGMTDGRGVHAIIDPVGGRNLAADLRVLAPLGRLVAFGLSEPVRGGGRPFLATLRSVLGMPKPGFLTLLNRNWSISGLNLGHLWGEIDRLRGVGESILTHWRDGHIRPVIAAQFPFKDAADAHRMLEDRKNLGKVLLVP